MSFKKRRQIGATRLLLAFKQDRGGYRKFAGDSLPCPTSLDECHDLPLVIGCATRANCARTGQPEASSYPEFNPWMYSLDALLPVMEIGQKQYWRPDPSKPNGTLTLNYYYFLSVIGWALSLLAVAGFSRLVKSK
jgi:hypothetical protein